MPTTISYAEFGTWYDQHRIKVLEPALETGLAALEQILGDGLTDRDLSRIRSVTGRVKSKRRTWRKMQQTQYQGLIASTDDIPVLIKDLVGLRITCTNLRDIDTVQAVLHALPTGGNGRRRAFRADLASEQDYVRSPKDSGYRGWHVAATIEVPAAGDRPAGAGPVACELQVRTLLQDSWGELTHEDTYSKDGELPPLVEVLSKRIADLFATLDDIAEDLRTELDRIDEAAVAEGDELNAPPDPLTESGQAADAASMLLDRWQRLDRPVDLASMAWAVQREFGAEVSDDWFGYRSFKRFLTAAVPDGEISTGGQAYLLPFNYGSRTEPPHRSGGPEREAAAAKAAEVEPVWVEAAAKLRTIDRGFPVLETDAWHQLYEALAEAWRRIGPVDIGPNVLNRVTRSARDRADAAGVQLSRRHLDYVARAVMAGNGSATGDSGDKPSPLPADELAERFAALTVQRMVDLRILEAGDRSAKTAIVHWLGGR